MKRFIVSLFVTLISILTFAQKSRFDKSIEIGGSYGINEITKVSLNASIVNGYHFNDYLFAGIGFGYGYCDGLSRDIYTYDLDGSSTYTGKVYDVCHSLHAFLRAKVNFTNTKISPFACLDGGISADFGDLVGPRMQDGFFYLPKIGFDYQCSNERKVSFALGYSGQHYVYDEIHQLVAKDRTDTIEKMANKVGTIAK